MAYHYNSGIVSDMQGGNFWEGAAIGLTVSLLNHAANSMSREAETSADPTKIRKSNPNDIAEGDVINMHSDKNDPLSLWAQQSKPGVGKVELHAHGYNASIGGMTTAEEVHKLLYAKSPTWRGMFDNGDKITLTLYSCQTGRGNGSIASLIKAAYPNVTVVAPTNNWAVNYNGYISGFYTVNYGHVKQPGEWKKI